MDYDRINLLLQTFHGSLEVPNTDKIRAEIMAELIRHNNGERVELVEEDEEHE